MSAVPQIKRLTGALLFAMSLFPVVVSAQTASCCISFSSCTAPQGTGGCAAGQAQVTCSAVASCPQIIASGQCCATSGPCSPKPATTACPAGTQQVACNTFAACSGGGSTGQAAGTQTTPAPAGAPPSGAVSLPDPLGGVSAPQVIGGAIRTFTGIAGAIALLMFVYGGIMYILSGGDGEKVKGAITILRNSAIGLVLIFGAYFFTSAIVSGILANPK